MRDDVRAAIEPAIGAQLQISTTWVAARAREQLLSRFRRRSKGETGRAPGALTNADRPLVLEQIERRGDVRTGETTPTLQRSEIVADAALYVFDRRAERGDIAFRQGGQSLHQDESAQMPRVAIGKRRELVEDVELVRPVHSLAMGVEHQEDAPRFRERHAADDRCGRSSRPAPAGGHAPPALAQTD